MSSPASKGQCQRQKLHKGGLLNGRMDRGVEDIGKLSFLELASALSM